MTRFGMLMLAFASLACAGEAIAQRRSYEGRVAKARSFLAQRDYPGAEAQARSAIKTDPERWEAHEVLGDALRFRADYEHAARAYDDAVARAPADRRERLQRERDRCSHDGVIAVRVEDGNRASVAGQHALAASHFAEAFARAPQRTDVALLAAKAFLAANRPRQALTLLESVAPALGDTAPFREVVAMVARDAAPVVDGLLTELRERLSADVAVAEQESSVRAGLLVAPDDARLHVWGARCASLRNDAEAFAAAIRRARATGWVPSQDELRDALLAPGLARMADEAASPRAPTSTTGTASDVASEVRSSAVSR
jgi:tetratricopeptide (TPR) repeat protein